MSLNNDNYDKDSHIIEATVENIVFALDVGTSTIVGIAGVQGQDSFRVLAAEICAHGNRAMFDGQIHDIGEVARAISIVRERLESKLDIPLKTAYIAAAGRALKTVRVEVSRELNDGAEIDGQLLAGMEAEALRKIRVPASPGGIRENNEYGEHGEHGDHGEHGEHGVQDYKFFKYINHTIIGQYLDGYPISNLLGHRGAGIKLDYLVTFLPRSVIDSLYAAMRRADIIVGGLMLEPVAALDAVVPKQNRRLNLALVDIGAGTSDIAITKDGNVFSYTTVPYAGDKITERICELFLTDFPTGERIKIEMSTNQPTIEFTDIFGRELSITFEEAYAAVMPIIKEMAEKIARAIATDNNASPTAVAMVGGGCQLPDLDLFISEALGIGRERVAIRGRDAIAGLNCDLDILVGPESITPIGIAICGAAGQCFHNDHFSIKLNNKAIQLSDINEYTVSDVLRAASHKPVRLENKPGDSLSFYVNGEKRTVQGGEGRPALIQINGVPASMETGVGFGDNIDIMDAQDGADARVNVSDLAPQVDAGTVVCAGVDYYIVTPRARINGRDCALNAEVRDGDSVELITKTTIRMFIDDYLRGEIGSSYIVNGLDVGESYVLSPGDEITILRDDSMATGERADVPGDAAVGEHTVLPVNTFTFELNGDSICMQTETPNLLIVDALNNIEIERSDRYGRLILKKNGIPAKLTDEIFNDDRVVIIWETKNNLSNHS